MVRAFVGDSTMTRAFPPPRRAPALEARGFGAFALALGGSGFGAAGFALAAGFGAFDFEAGAFGPFAFGGGDLDVFDFFGFLLAIGLDLERSVRPTDPENR